MTHDISKVLYDLNLQSDNLEFRRLPVAPVGGTVYMAKMTVMLPKEISKELLIENLESISECTRVHAL